MLKKHSFPVLFAVDVIYHSRNLSQLFYCIYIITVITSVSARHHLYLVKNNVSILSADQNVCQ